MNGLMKSTRAELLRLRRWPALWVLVGVWLTMNLTFGYIFNYIAYRTGDSSNVNEGIPPEALLADLLPSALPEVLVQGMPMFGGAILLILGAVAVGSGYGWGTWKTVLTQGPGRVASFGGTLVALGDHRGGRRAGHPSGRRRDVHGAGCRRVAADRAAAAP